jgi:uncharacterized protein YxjI
MSDLPAQAARFRLHKQLFAEASDYVIEDATGRAAFHVGVRKFRLRARLEIADGDGRVVASIQQKLLSLTKHFVVASEGCVATLRREQHTQHNDGFLISLADGASLLGQGDFARHEYRIMRGASTVAWVSGGWFDGDTTYGVAVAPGEPAVLLLALAIVIDDATASLPNFWAPAQPAAQEA